MVANKVFAILLCAIISSANGLPLGDKETDGRIVGGNSTEIHVLPYQVSIMMQGHHFCGASIIAADWVLTAAHCMRHSASRLSIRVGSNYWTKGGSIHRIDRYINHEKFGRDQNGFPVHDISLIHLKDPIEFDNNKKPIPLFEDGDMAVIGSYAVVSGWGATGSGGMGTNELRAVLVPIVSRTVCAKAYEARGRLPDHQICAGYPEGGKDSCQGDSGGPLALDGRLAGVVSWGLGCALPKIPGVYTEVAKYRDWIKDKSGL